jgi:hypothetical protein
LISPGCYRWSTQPRKQWPKSIFLKAKSKYTQLVL